MTEIDVQRHIAYKIEMGELRPHVGQRMLDLYDQGVSKDYQELLRAAVFQDPPPVVYHTAPLAMRDTILRHGLLAFAPGEGRYGKLASGQPRGVYVCSTPDYDGKWSHGEPFDVWSVFMQDLPWEYDTVNPEGCWYIPEDVPQTHLALFHMGSE